MSSLKELELSNCPELKTLPDSLGRPLLLQAALPDDEVMTGIAEEPPSPPSTTKGLRVGVGFCHDLNDSLMTSISWVMEETRGQGQSAQWWYRRKIAKLCAS
ncbi:unnamed protein product [Calypogeia fissa]